MLCSYGLCVYIDIWYFRRNAAHPTHVWGAEKVSNRFLRDVSLVQDPAAFAVNRVGVYIIFSSHTLVALLAFEARFIPLAKNNTRISHVVCFLLDHGC